MSKLRIGLIGCGWIAQGAHLPAWANFKDAEVVAYCDIVEDRLKESCEKFGKKKTYLDYRELLASEEVDAVDICTPNGVHADPTVAALEAGKHVIVEKPIARNASEAAKMLEAEKQTGRKLQVALCQRFGSASQVLKNYVDAGKIGEVYYARAQALRRRGIPSWGNFTNKEIQGGGPLIDIGVHILDLTIWLMGHPKPVSASAVTYVKFGTREGIFGEWGPWDYKNYTVEDFASGFVRFDNGASLVLEASFAANTKGVFSTALMGTEGGAQLSTFDQSPLSIFREEHGSLVDLSPVSLPKVNVYEAELRAFVDCIRNDTVPPVTAEQALVVTKILDAFYKSAEMGREVPVD